MPLPPRELSPNRSRNVNPRAKAVAVRTYRHLVYALAIDAANKVQWSTPSKTRLRLRVGLKAQSYADKQCYHPQDPDNAVACLKAAIDGLCDAGVIAGDTWEHLVLEVEGDRAWDCGVLMTLYAV